ncbi:hypothetical protein SAMN05421595_2109 [Austwickia chelonae]|uniref:Uncharacterized protein n=1 Tax=Austwickia chelonae NBRC 105200 TaxID=1184607 RepID=K6VJS4_9MICO|nr:hypothetical protein [Austwickia chelonae]GAB76974.1 hypothetical protein AUCHE_04_00140 [Austwickia chelonae NBRC 105200]SEW32894.1 hypothetical protein SAMN05421595_2109 [Austwickia chelonae]
MTRRLLRMVSGAAALAATITFIPFTTAHAASPASAPASHPTSTASSMSNPHGILGVKEVALPFVQENRRKPQKRNILNPRPVCNAWQDTRITITKVHAYFKPSGAIETTNNTTEPLPLTQSLSKTKTFRASVSGSFGFDLFSVIKATITPTLEHSMSWNVGQTIGPYKVPPGKTARASYGFNVISYEGTRQGCNLNGTWSRPRATSGTAPLTNAVKVQFYDNPTDVLATREAEKVPTTVVPATAAAAHRAGAAAPTTPKPGAVKPVTPPAVAPALTPAAPKPAVPAAPAPAVPAPKPAAPAPSAAASPAASARPAAPATSSAPVTPRTSAPATPSADKPIPAAPGWSSGSARP